MSFICIQVLKYILHIDFKIHISFEIHTLHKKAQCVLWFIETKSDNQAVQNFRCKYGRKPCAQRIIQAWHKKFMETGSVLQRKGAG